MIDTLDSQRVKRSRYMLDLGWIFLGHLPLGVLAAVLLLIVDRFGSSPGVFQSASSTGISLFFLGLTLVVGLLGVVHAVMTTGDQRGRSDRFSRRKSELVEIPAEKEDPKIYAALAELGFSDMSGSLRVNKTISAVRSPAEFDRRHRSRSLPHYQVIAIELRGHTERSLQLLIECYPREKWVLGDYTNASYITLRSVVNALVHQK